MPQAFGMSQSPCVMQPHVPPLALVTHAMSLACVPQLTHAPPVSPHVPLAPPFWHIAPSQQPALQGLPGFEQLIVHALSVHDWLFMGQSLTELHATHVPVVPQSGVPPMHVGVQLSPPVPQYSGCVPGWHSPPPQHPLLHWPGPVQVVVHECPVQASRLLQSAELLHPHVPLGCRQAFPFELARQSTQSAPPSPHAV